MTSPFLAIDVGASRIKSALIVDGEVREHTPEPVAKDISGLLLQIVATYDRAAAGKRLAWGLCMPGLIDVSSQTLRYSANFDARDVPVVELLTATLPGAKSVPAEIEVARRLTAAGEASVVATRMRGEPSTRRRLC